MRKKVGMAAITVYGFFCFMLLFGVDGQAYIDPSVMTYVIQAVAGIVIAVGAAAGIYWRKARRKIKDKLGIDVDKKKEKETDDIIVK
ncbi:MAG: hypothetical protein K2N87_18820 [Eubacterium sp.]|nr:hypothetical protein [Eubacterium sp.]